MGRERRERRVGRERRERRARRERRVRRERKVGGRGVRAGERRVCWEMRMRPKAKRSASSLFFFFPLSCMVDGLPGVVVCIFFFFNIILSFQCIELFLYILRDKYWYTVNVSLQ